MVAQTNHQYTKYVVENTETVICLQIGKTNTAKTPPGDFLRSSLPKFHYYHNKRLQVNES